MGRIGSTAPPPPEDLIRLVARRAFDDLNLHRAIDVVTSRIQSESFTTDAPTRAECRRFRLTVDDSWPTPAPLPEYSSRLAHLLAGARQPDRYLESGSTAAEQRGILTCAILLYSSHELRAGLTMIEASPDFPVWPAVLDSSPPLSAQMRARLHDFARQWTAPKHFADENTAAFIFGFCQASVSVWVEIDSPTFSRHCSMVSSTFATADLSSALEGVCIDQ